MAATMLTSTNPSLVSIGHLKIISDNYAAREKQYPMLFKETQARQMTETFPHLGALSTWQADGEGEPFNLDEVVEGNTATFTFQRYTNSYEITHEALKWDKYRELESKAVNMGTGAADAEESGAAGVINNGFSTNGFDGKPLFATDHPLASSAAIGSNRVSGALSDATLKDAITLMRGTVNESGIKIHCRPSTAWCAANLEFVMATILQSAGAAGQISNNKNVLPGLRQVVMDDLTDNYWGIKDDSPNLNNLIFMWYEKPTFGRKESPNSRNILMWGYSAFRPGYADWRGVVGSTGA